MTLLDRRSIFPAQQAAELFQQVIARDPAFAPAYAGLANAYAAAVSSNWSSPGSRPPKRPCPIMRPGGGQSSSARSPAGRGTRGHGLRCTPAKLDWQKADESFRRAIDLNPSLTQSLRRLFSRRRSCRWESWTRRSGSCSRRCRADPLSLNVQREMASAAVHDRAVRGGHRYLPADTRGRPRLPVCRLAPRESADVRGQTGGGVSRV